MDISVRPVGTWVPEDRSWLGSRDGTEVTQSITLDTSAFVEATHYPDGYLKSGTVLAAHDNNLYGPYAGAGSEVQTVTVSGAPTGGTFTLTYAGQTTSALAYNAAAATVQTALEALSNLAPADVVVTGSAGGPYTITFGGTLANANVAQMTASGASLTGGDSPAVTVDTALTGGARTAVGFLFSSVSMRAGGPNVGAALHWRGVIKESNLPTNHGLDSTARTALAAKFMFKA
jgi:hypothetical protein